MSALFGKSPQKGDATLLLIDVENGSVASALARVSKKDPPKLFGERRIALPILHPLSSGELAQKIDRAVNEALLHSGEVAARLRNNPQTAAIGHISGVRIFLSAPWAGTTIGEKGLQWGYEPEMLSQLHKSAGLVAEDIPVSIHSFSRAAASAAFAFSTEETLLCIVTGEVIELALVDQGLVRGRATIPLGLHTVLRTLQSHAGLSMHEAHSALKLAHHTDEKPLYHEPLGAVARHFAEEFADVASELLDESEATTILIIAPEPTGDWFAKALTNHPQTVSLFSEGGVVRALRPRHCMQYIAAHAEVPDLPLMLETMFISAGYAGANSGI